MLLIREACYESTRYMRTRGAAEQVDDDTIGTGAIEEFYDLGSICVDFFHELGMHHAIFFCLLTISY